MDELREEIQSQLAGKASLSRRRLMRAAVLAAGGAGLLGMERRPSAAQQLSAMDALQLVLALEHLTAAFYEQAVTFLQAQPAESFPTSISGDVKSNALALATTIRSHEQTHEQALTALIRCLGGTPVDRCQYRFVLTNTTTILQTARTLEETGVSAYLGALSSLVGARTVLVEVAKIVTVEARHASMIRRVLGEADPLSGAGTVSTCNGDPSTKDFSNGAFDRPASITEVRAAVASMITSVTCGPLRT